MYITIYRCNARVHIRYLSCYKLYGRICMQLCVFAVHWCFPINVFEQHLSSSRFNDGCVSVWARALYVYAWLLYLVIYDILLQSTSPYHAVLSRTQVLYGIKGNKQSSQIKSCLVIFFSSLFAQIFFLALFLFLQSMWVLLTFGCVKHWKKINHSLKVGWIPLKSVNRFTLPLWLLFDCNFNQSISMRCCAAHTFYDAVREVFAVMI